MGLESTTYLSGLTESWPLAGDLKSQGDDHLRLVKLALKNSFPEASRPFYYPKFSSKIANFSPNNTTDDNTIYLVDTTAGNVVVTLPAMPANPWQIRVIKTSADANVVSFVGTVSGSTLPTLKSEDESYHIGSNGTAYFDLTGVIRNGSITTAKFANMSASRLLGNATGAPTIPGEISLSTDLVFTGSVLGISTALLGALVGSEGGVLSTAGGSSIFGITKGAHNDDAYGGMMFVASDYTKTTVAWAVGSGNGALDTGAIAPNSSYHVYKIKRLDTGVVDYLISLAPSAGQPNVVYPANYTVKRYLGSMRTDGSSQWRKFTQTGKTFIWDVSTQDVTAGVSTNARVNTTLTVPIGTVVEALFRVGVSGTVSQAYLFTSLQESDQAPTASGGFGDILLVGGSAANGAYERMTDVLGRIGVRSSNNGNGSLNLWTYGWNDPAI